MSPRSVQQNSPPKAARLRARSTPSASSDAPRVPHVVDVEVLDAVTPSRAAEPEAERLVDVTGRSDWSERPDSDEEDSEFSEKESLELDGLPVVYELGENDEEQSLAPLAPLAVEERDGAENLPAPMRTNLPLLSRGRDSLRLYLREVGRFPMLKPEEELELAHRVRENGDSDAAFRLVSSHLRLVVRIAMDFQRRWMQNVLDLIQEGNVGLMRAVNRFDPDKGIKFSYYAAYWIRAYILKFIMDNWRMVKIGTTQSQRKLFFNLNRERQKLIAEGFDPDSEILAARLGVEVGQIEEMQQRLDASDMSLDSPLTDESGSGSRLDFLPALGPGVEETYAGREVAEIVRDRLKEILPSLSSKEEYILQHRLLSDEPVTLREIGERYNITRERVRQLEVRLLQKLREHFASSSGDFSSDWISHP